jgi:hypothetical protein
LSRYVTEDINTDEKK